MLDAISDALHRIQVRQLVPEVEITSDAVDVDGLAQQLRPELVQLWYQMALNGRRDLGHAPSPRSGFEMSLLRMLAFRPNRDGTQPTATRAVASTSASVSPAPKPSSSKAAQQARAAVGESTKPVQAPSPMRAPIIEAPRDTVRPVAASGATVAPAAVPAAASLLVTDTEHWLELVARSSVRGPVRLLAEHAGFIAHRDGTLQLSLSPGDEHLKSPSLVLQLGDAVATMLGGPVQLRFDTSQSRGDTARVRNARHRDEKQAGAEQGFATDPDIQRLVQLHGAQIVPDSIRPLGDS